MSTLDSTDYASVTTIDPPTPRWRSTLSSGPVSLGGAMKAEWVKFRSLRSTWALLASTVVGLIALAFVVAYNTRNPAGIQAEDLAASATLQGYHLGELLLGSLGVLVVTAEYSSGTIRNTLVAVPRRLPVLWAKLLVISPIVIVTMLAATFAAFFAAQAFLSQYRVGASLTDPGALRAVVFTAVYLGALTALGSAIGWIVRSTPGALVTYLGVVLVLPPMVSTLFGSVGSTVAKFLPSEAGTSLVSSASLPNMLSPTAGGLVLLAWLVGTSAIAVTVLLRRDA